MLNIYIPRKSSERNLSCFLDIKKPRRIEHLQSEDPSPQIRILMAFCLENCSDLL